MSFLFDFGLSQEDPFSEQRALDIHFNDNILSLASAGEIPLSLLSLNEHIRMKAVDISESQIRLCRLKLAAALHLDFPVNGDFLGFGKVERNERIDIYRTILRPVLPEADGLFWDQHLPFIDNGIINGGRFEQYIGKLRRIGLLFIGKKNLDRLIACTCPDEQYQIFDKFIATRKSLRLLFKIAFHPAIYKKRGLQEQALIHAGKSTGERFYGKFRDFCTATPASENYFLQFFLHGNCLTKEAYPPYLQPVNKQRLMANLAGSELETTSLQEALKAGGKGFYNKIHLSNVGDWLNDADFADLLGLIRNYCSPGTRICYRFLQKNYFSGKDTVDFIINREFSAEIEKSDRFPFYGILSITRT